MSDKTTGEWTKEYVIMLGVDNYVLAGRIADTHNATLAAEAKVKEAKMSDQGLEARITEYLSAGGLFNPELMEHEKGRDLLIDCRAALAAERERLAAAQDLMTEVRQWHSDKESPDYNECDAAPCQWCESSLKLGTDCMDAHVRQKTWELQQQLAAERQQWKSNHQPVEELERQLAAERERADGAEQGELNEATKLAAERERTAQIAAAFKLEDGQLKPIEQLAAEREKPYPRFKCLICKKGANELMPPHYLERVSATGKDAPALWLCTEHLNQQLAADRSTVSELAEALRMLRDYQNGCPLPSYEKGWNEAMSMTDTVLAKVEK